MSNRKVVALVLFALLHIVAALAPRSPQTVVAGGSRDEDESSVAASENVWREPPYRVTLLPGAPARGPSAVCMSAALGLR